MKRATPGQEMDMAENSGDETKHEMDLAEKSGDGVLSHKSGDGTCKSQEMETDSSKQ